MSLYGSHSRDGLKSIAGSFGAGRLLCLPMFFRINLRGELFASPISLSSRLCKACIGAGTRAEGVPLA